MENGKNTTGFLEVAFSGVPVEMTEILIAELSDAGFESFTEGEQLLAYVRNGQWNEQVVQVVLKKYALSESVSFSVRMVQEKNWNEIWEQNYEPVFIEKRCLVRAPFHPPCPEAEYELVIEPKMSFGTAHHETTSLMVSLLLEEKVTAKRLLDMGCGTGILAILAAKMGTGEITAIDNDDWAYNNTLDNLVKNNTPHIAVIKGGAEAIPGGPFDIILANINRNVLLEDIPVYVERMEKGGILLLSGFHAEDLPAIEAAAGTLGKKLTVCKTKNNWVAARFL